MIELFSVSLILIQKRVQRLFYQFMQEITVLLKIFLQELEKTQVLLILHIVSMNICVFQYLSALYNFIYCFFQEFKLTGRILLYLMQQINFGLNDWSKLPRVLLCFVVVVESLKVKHVPVKFTLCFLPLLFFF